MLWHPCTQEFHPRMLGLTGSLEDVKRTSKAYRWGRSLRVHAFHLFGLC